MPFPLEVEVLKLVPPLLPFDRPRTFDEATQLSATPCNDTYKVQLRADWSYGPRVNGGYLIGVLLRAAKEACARRKDVSHPDPSSWNTNFLEAATVGEADVVVKIRRTSFSSMYLQAELWQKEKLRVTATIIQSDIQASQNHPVKLPQPPIPELPIERLRWKFGDVTEDSLIAEGWKKKDFAKYQKFFQTKPYVKLYLPPGSDLENSRHVVHPTFGPSVRDMWYSMGVEQPLNPVNLPVLIDSFVPLHLNYPQGANYFIVTQSISCEMKRTNVGWTWLFCRGEMRECSGGKYVTDVTLLNTDGEIVALSRVVNVLISVETLKGGKAAGRSQENKL